MDIQAIQQGLVNALAPITGLRAYAALPDSINPPVCAVTELDVTYNGTFAGSASSYGMVETLFSLGLYVSRADDAAGRKALVGYLNPSGSQSIPAALQTDRTLGGACRTMIVERVRGAYRLYTIGSIDYLGATFDVRVWSTP